MGQPFLGEIRLAAFGPTNMPAPKGWAQCNGQFLPINQNQALFSILGTTYGGNGQTTFALPDFRGRVPTHRGSLNLGEKAGQEFHTLIQSEMPTHIHFLSGTSNTGNSNVTTGAVPAVSQTPVYTGAQNLVPINPATISNVGGSQAHENRQPLLVINFIIALQGIFPSRN